MLLLSSLAISANFLTAAPSSVASVHALHCAFDLLPDEPPLVADDMRTWPASRPLASLPSEPAIQNVRQLTFGGQNAEAYWSLRGDQIVYQTKQPGYPDEQVFVMRADGSRKQLVSTGKGRCTCSYFSPDMRFVYFSSTHAKNEGAQAPLDMRKGYLWKVNPEFSLYRKSLAAARKGDIAQPETVLTRSGYIAETTIAPNGKYLTFTGDFEGDIDIYRATLDGKEVKKLTDEEGYDGGPFVSWDSKRIVFRRDKIDTDAEREDYRKLHAEHLVRPSKLEIWIMDADGTNKRQVTNLNCASFAPFILPDNKRIIFSSNYGDPKGREFDLFVINVDGTNLQRVTYSPDFDGFPMISRDGKRLIWASNRNGSTRGETNIFVADWRG
ncbi:MAG: hypothetical protein SFX74_06360 [Fimbriimonadaceae bacterium]|nr:hypothetical protein [Fimbriimonadaceae bacterium]